MKAKCLTVELDRVGGGSPKLKVRMMLNLPNGDTVWRGWELDLMNVPDDPIGTWEALRSAVAALKPQEPNPDPKIQNLVTRVGVWSIAKGGS